MMIENHQQWLQLNSPPVANPSFATILSVKGTVPSQTAIIRYSDGGTSQKSYRLPAGFTWKAGMLVRLEETCGTLVIGRPV